MQLQGPINIFIVLYSLFYQLERYLIPGFSSWISFPGFLRSDNYSMLVA